MVAKKLMAVLEMVAISLVRFTSGQYRHGYIRLSSGLYFVGGQGVSKTILSLAMKVVSPVCFYHIRCRYTRNTHGINYSFQLSIFLQLGF